VKDLHVTTHSIQIKYDAAKTSEAALKAAIEKLGYKILDEAHDHHHHN
jgi:copper chaperone CopZ